MIPPNVKIVKRATEYVNFLYTSALTSFDDDISYSDSTTLAAGLLESK